MALLQADIISELSEATLRQERRRWQPSRLVFTGVGAAGALFGPPGIVLDYLLGRAH